MERDSGTEQSRREQSCSAAALSFYTERAAAFHFPEWVPVTPTPQKAAYLGKEKRT